MAHLCPFQSTPMVHLALQDTHLKCKAKLGQSNLTVKQHVPGGKWALVSTPGTCSCFVAVWNTAECWLRCLFLARTCVLQFLLVSAVTFQPCMRLRSHK